MLICLLRLPICLRMVGDTKVLQHIQLLTKLLEEGGCGPWISVGYNLLWEPNKWEYTIFKQLHYSFGINFLLTRYKNNSLGAIMICDYHN
jgi:hypothetical protein